LQIGITQIGKFQIRGFQPGPAQVSPVQIQACIRISDPPILDGICTTFPIRNRIGPGNYPSGG